MQQNQKMSDADQNNFMKEYVDSVAGHETTIEEAREFIHRNQDSFTIKKPKLLTQSK